MIKLYSNNGVLEGLLISSTEKLSISDLIKIRKAGTDNKRYLLLDISTEAGHILYKELTDLGIVRKTVVSCNIQNRNNILAVYCNNKKLDYTLERIKTLIA